MSMTVSKNPKLRASLKELEELGSPVDFSVAEPDNLADVPTLEIEQVGLDARIFQQGDRDAGYMVYLRLTNQTMRAIIPLDLDLGTFWGERVMDWLLPCDVPVHYRRKPDSSYRAYKFPNGPEISHEETVLNEIFLNRRKLLPRRPYEGWLLATGRPLPAGIVTGQKHDVILTITGSDHMVYSQNISFWIDRGPAQSQLVKRRPIAAGGVGSTTTIADLPQSELPLSGVQAPRKGSLYK